MSIMHIFDSRITVSQNKSTWFAWRFVHIDRMSLFQSYSDGQLNLEELELYHAYWVDDDLNCFIPTSSQKHGEEIKSDPF